MADFYKGLVDYRGMPIQKASLTSEQAAPTTRGIRQPYGGHPAAGLTPGRLGRLLRDSIEGSPERYLELAEDMEERDLHYTGVLSTRKRQVAGLDIAVEAAGDSTEEEAQAELVREVLDRDEFQDELVDMLDAIGKGFSCCEIVWDTSEDQWRPHAIKYRDPRWFEFDREDPEKIMLRGDGGQPEELKPFGWIVHRAKVKSGLTIRGGLARAVAWTYLFKSFTLKDWAIFCEAYGQPLRLGKFDPAASETDKDKLLEAVANIGSDFAAIIPAAMSVDFIKADISGSHELYERRANWLDQQVSKLVLGQTGTTDVIKGGGYASSKVHDGVREDIEKVDARQLAATLNRDLARVLVDLNFGPRPMGTKYPRITIGRPEEEDVKSLVENVTKLIPFGLKVGMGTMRDKIGIAEPEADEELLTAPRAATPVAAEPGAKRPAPNELPAPDDEEVSAHKAGAAAGDAIDAAVADMLADGGWEPLVKPVVDGLEQEIAAAGSIDEVREILRRRAATMGLAAFTDLLARSAFVARLAGEAEESLS